MQIEMTIKGLMVDPITNMPIVILRDKDGQRVLPIWVGIFEANAIALQIENVATPRPMTHDLLRNVIHDLQGRRSQKIVVCDLKENTFYALIYLRVNGEHGGDRRAAERRDRAGAARRGRRSSSRTRSSTTPRRSTSRRRRRTPSGCRSGSRASTRTTWANTRCSGASVRLDRPFLDAPQHARYHGAHLAAAPPTTDDRRHRQPERRRRQDHDRHQPGGRAGAARQADAAHRSRSAGQQHDVVPRHARR